MPKLYPLLIEPKFVERIWGTRDLRPIYDLQPDKPIGEAWLTGDECRVVNGEFAGRTLGELCKQFGAELVGESAPVKDRFPLLIKFLFPREKLSVQVHPDDEMARRMGQPCGKTECWYVLSAEPGAKVSVGLKPGVTKEQFAAAIKEQKAEEMLNWMDVHPGELIYVEAGTVHAIGPGSILVETQQNSDTTFRLYDYGRPRELHLEQGLAAIKNQVSSGKIAPQRLHEIIDLLAVFPCFLVDRRQLNPPAVYWREHNREQARVMTAVVCLKGEGVLTAPNSEEIQFEPGYTIVVPPTVEEFTVSSDAAQFLTMRVPDAASFEHDASPMSVALSY